MTLSTISRTKLEIIGTCLLLAGGYGGFRVWLADHDAHMQLQQTIATVQTERDTAKKELANELEKIRAESNAIKTPAQAVGIINKYVPIPVPIGIPTEDSKLPVSLQEQLNSPIPKQIVIPAQDAVPVARFVESCRECNSKLAAAVKDNVQLTTERDAAIVVAHGGTKWLRIKRAAKWISIGIIVGVIADRVHH